MRQEGRVRTDNCRSMTSVFLTVSCVGVEVKAIVRACFLASATKPSRRANWARNSVSCDANSALYDDKKRESPVMVEGMRGGSDNIQAELTRIRATIT